MPTAPGLERVRAALQALIDATDGLTLSEVEEIRKAAGVDAAGMAHSIRSETRGLLQSVDATLRKAAKP
ncbi:MAG: hypothetical protein VW405_02815 [Rhodospirillaceae bacterium]